jgi:hypothetical protein
VPHQQNRKHVTWDCVGDGDADAGGCAVDCVGSGEEECAPVGVADADVVCVAGAEEAEWLGVVDLPGEAESCDEVGSANSLKPLPLPDGVGLAVLVPEAVPAPLAVPTDPAATLPVGALPPPELRKLPSSTTQTTAIPAKAPMTQNPVPRRRSSAPRPRRRSAGAAETAASAARPRRPLPCPLPCPCPCPAMDSVDPAEPAEPLPPAEFVELGLPAERVESAARAA